ncbi:MAG: methyltransferase domain-containing protein [Acidimicrobiales bacterium]
MDREAWDERYATDELVWRADPNRFLVEEVAGMAPGRALDLACGEGRNALWLAQEGWRVVAVDFSRAGLAKGRALAERRGLEASWVEADVLRWAPAPHAFNLVTVLYLQLPGPDRTRALATAAAALAPGGALLVVGHDSTNLAEGFGGPQDPSVLYGPEDVVADLGDLVVERAARVRRPVETPEGVREAVDALVRARRPG